jgi:hypothetical protein
MKDVVFWEVTPRCDVSEERSLSVIMVTRISDTVFVRSTRRLLVTANVLSSPIFLTLITEARRSS